MQEQTEHLMVPRLKAKRCQGRHHPDSYSEELVLSYLGDVSPAVAEAGDVSLAAPLQ